MVPPWTGAIFSFNLVVEKDEHLSLKSYSWKHWRDIPPEYKMKYVLFGQVWWPDGISTRVRPPSCLHFLVWRLKSALPSHGFRRKLPFAGWDALSSSKRETNHIIVKAVTENIVLSAPLPGPYSEEPNRAVGYEFHHSDFPSWDLPHPDPNTTPSSNVPEFIPGAG